MDLRSSPRHSRRLRSLLWRARFVVAAVCCGLAAAGITQALRPPSPPNVPVVVTARAIDAGTALGSADVRVVGMPVAFVPDDAASAVADVTGRTISVPVPAGIPLVPGLVAAGDPVASAPEGTVVAPVRLDPAVVALLSPGVRVDLLAGAQWAALGGSAESVGDAGSTEAAGPGDPAEPGDEGGQDPAEVDPGAEEATGDAPAVGGPPDPYLARSAVVLPGAPSPDDGGLLGGGAASGGVVLVAVAPQDAVRLAAVSGLAEITAVLVP